MHNEDSESQKTNPPDEVLLIGSSDIIFLREEDGKPGQMTDAMRKRLREKYSRPKTPPDVPPEQK